MEGWTSTMFRMRTVNSNFSPSERRCCLGMYCASLASGYLTGSITCMWLSQELDGILSRGLLREGAIGFGFVVTRLRLHGNFDRRTRGFLRLCRKAFMRSLTVGETISAPFLIFRIANENTESWSKKQRVNRHFGQNLRIPKGESGDKLWIRHHVLGIEN